MKHTALVLQIGLIFLTVSSAVAAPKLGSQLTKEKKIVDFSKHNWSKTSKSQVDDVFGAMGMTRDTLSVSPRKDANGKSFVVIEKNFVQASGKNQQGHSSEIGLEVSLYGKKYISYDSKTIWRDEVDPEGDEMTTWWVQAQKVHVNEPKDAMLKGSYSTRPGKEQNGVLISFYNKRDGQSKNVLFKLDESSPIHREIMGFDVEAGQNQYVVYVREGERVVEYTYKVGGKYKDNNSGEEFNQSIYVGKRPVALSDFSIGEAPGRETVKAAAGNSGIKGMQVQSNAR